MDFREFSAKTVDDAITKACIEMGLSSDRLEINVISEGSSGFLGLGSKPAVIQVREKEVSETVPSEEKTAEIKKAETKPAAEEKKAAEPKKNEPAAEKKTAAPAEKNQAAAPAAGKETEAPAGKKEDRPAAKKPAGKAKQGGDFSGKKEGRAQDHSQPHHEEKPIVDHNDEEIARMKAAASSFLEKVFKAMELPVSMSMDYNHETGSLEINLEGEDMGILIGKRGQTLDSLQYLVSLVVNRDQKNYVRVKLDTEDYRRRRKETLENLAKNIAYKVKRTHRPVSLEAMNPYERRIIHSALQNNRYVETHSEGNEPYRFVVVTPKKFSDRED
ncbi:MAG: RNA-binding cell elongation regulator Jag/EloR [Eubacteriales bacterium]|jgi:spoIIIJ-associated protein